MPDERITNDELARRLEYYVRDLQKDLARIQTDLSLLVPREVFDLQMIALRTELDQAKKDIQAQEDRDRVRNRLAVSALLIPIVLLIAQFFISTRGAL